MALRRYRVLTAIAGLCLGTQILAATPPDTTRDKAWPQSYSDIAPDPAVRFGTLPNGMRYAIMKNATPAHQASLRLRIGSGSLEENDAEQGLAHFLEHMSFKGSTYVPAGEMMKILQRKGLAFGPDTNAFTSWDQTVYMLDLPETDDDSVDTGLMLMRETGGELLISDSQLEPERGVVLSEERLRDTPQYRASVAGINFLLDGQLAPKRFPIGKVDILHHAPASLLREFYQANYRPDRATLIAVGDFDPAVVERKITALFGNWQPVGPETAEPDLGAIAQRGLTAKIVELPGSATRVQLAWIQPYDDAPDTVAKERKEVIDLLGLAVLNRRLSVLAHSQHPPFLEAGASFEDLFKSARIGAVDAQTSPDHWREGLAAIEQEQRRIVDFGVSQEELKREILEWRTSLQNALAGSATRRTPDLASELVKAVNEDTVFNSPESDLKIFDQAVAGLTTDDIRTALGKIFAGSGPLVEVSTPAKIDGGESTVLAAYNAAHAVKLAAPSAEAALVWPYTNFGKPGAVAARQEIADLGFTAVTFANGVKLAVKPTKLRDDQVLVGVRVGDGRLDLPMDRSSPLWAAAALVPGGLRALSQEDMERVLAAKIYNVGFAVEDDAFYFQGATRPQDLDTQMQVLTAYVTEPGFRPEAFEQQRTATLDALPQIEATANGVMRRDLSALTHNGDKRWGFPTREQLLAAKPDDLKALLQDPLAKGQIEVTIVGDITLDRAIELTAASFGALPKRPVTPIPPNERIVHFPAPVAPIALTHKGRADQAIAYIAWPLPDLYANLAETRVLNLADDILQNRILDKLRIEDGATYSPNSGVAMSEAFPGYGYGYSMAETPPPKIPGFYATVAKITADMREHGATEDELTRARLPRVERLKKAQLTNEYWLQWLSGSQSDPRRLNVIRTTFSDYDKVTIIDIKQAVARYLTDDHAWKLTVEAQPIAAVGQ